MCKITKLDEGYPNGSNFQTEWQTRMIYEYGNTQSEYTDRQTEKIR